MLEAACVFHARQGIPLTYEEFIDIATLFAKRDEDHRFSREFVKGFVKRHESVLCGGGGKITSPTRCLETTQEKTKEFIDLMNSYMRGNTLNAKNLVVFDECVIGDNKYVPVVIGERRKSGGGNINVLRVREKALGCYIPFSMPDGSTPFRVFIFKSGCRREGRCLAHALTQTAERGLRTCPHRLFLESRKGFLTADLFKIVMEEFIKWWRLANPGLHCFMLLTT